LYALTYEAIPPVPVPSEYELDGRRGSGADWSLFPDLSVEASAAEELLASRDRARLQVRLGAVALPTVLAALEQSLDGRAPHLLRTQPDFLDVHFTVGDHSGRAWRKVADMAWALGDLLGGGRDSLTKIQIRHIDLSGHLERIPEQYRQPEDFRLRHR
jgi:hypothetical protein